MKFRAAVVYAGSEPVVKGKQCHGPTLASVKEWAKLVLPGEPEGARVEFHRVDLVKVGEMGKEDLD